MEKDKFQEMAELGIRILCSCRNELYGRYPYLDGAFACLKYQPCAETNGIETDGDTLLFQPQWLLSLYMKNPQAVRNGYLHVLLHCLFLHPFQGKNIDIRLWNLACDMAVERILERENNLTNADKNPVSAQLIYEELRREKDPFKLEKLEKKTRFDDHINWGKCSGKDSGIKRKWERILVYTTRGKETKKQRAGAAKGNKKEEIDELYASRYDYKKFLKKFAFPREETELDIENFDYSFYCFGMEYYGNIPLIEPLEYKEVSRLEELIIAIDTSGSCSKETVQRFLGETYSILNSRENFFQKMNVYILQCDCGIQNETVIHCREEWKKYCENVKIEGRGGTDFRPVFRYIQDKKAKNELKNLKALIYFTDGDGVYPREKPDYETAFVFLKKTDSMKLVPDWARHLVVGN